MKLLPLQLLIHCKNNNNNNKITRGYALAIRGLGDQLNANCFQVVQSGGGGGLGICIAVVEQ